MSHQVNRELPCSGRLHKTRNIGGGVQSSRVTLEAANHKYYLFCAKHLFASKFWHYFLKTKLQRYIIGPNGTIIFKVNDRVSFLVCLKAIPYLVMQLILLTVADSYSIIDYYRGFHPRPEWHQSTTSIVESLVLLSGYISFIKKIRGFYEMWQLIKYRAGWGEFHTPDTSVECKILKESWWWWWWYDDDDDNKIATILGSY